MFGPGKIVQVDRIQKYINVTEYLDMNKENNRSAAGLRRSAIVERIRLREEWSELKGTADQPIRKRTQTNKKVPSKENIYKDVLKNTGQNRLDIKSRKNEINKLNSMLQSSSEVLHGIVALVEIGMETRALALRAALTALGATVVPSWSPLVTHLIWQEGGCRAIRAKARALACRLVSPLWVEACAASARRLPSQAFPAAARPSDLPSPRTLRVLLKKAEMENIPLDVLFSSEEDRENKQGRLRMSSETENDTSHDKSSDKSHDKTDKSRDTTATDIESRVNTAPRRAFPNSSVESPKTKSRRKLFTQKEAEITKNSDEDSEAEPTQKKQERKKPIKLTGRERRELARAERIARRLVTACTAPANQNKILLATLSPRIVLTGMDRTERHVICNAIRNLKGKVQSHVNKRTTHVILGTCRSDDDRDCSGVTVINHCDKPTSTVPNDVQDNSTRAVHRSEIQKARTLNALLGAARGCRVLYAQWILDSEVAKQWVHHHGYEVPHLKKISLKARRERTALCKQRHEYAYDVFNGMRVRISRDTEQKDAAIQLLTLCGAVVLNDDGRQNSGRTQNGGNRQNGGVRQDGVDQDFDITIGINDGEVSSKWVFDSVAAARVRTTRRYINNHVNSIRDVNTQGSVR